MPHSAPNGAEEGDEEAVAVGKEEEHQEPADEASGKVMGVLPCVALLDKVRKKKKRT